MAFRSFCAENHVEIDSDLTFKAHGPSVPTQVAVAVVPKAQIPPPEHVEVLEPRDELSADSHQATDAQIAIDNPAGEDDIQGTNRVIPSTPEPNSDEHNLAFFKLRDKPQRRKNTSIGPGSYVHVRGFYYRGTVDFTFDQAVAAMDGEIAWYPKREVP